MKGRAPFLLYQSFLGLSIFPSRIDPLPSLAREISSFKGLPCLIKIPEGAPTVATGPNALVNPISGTQILSRSNLLKLDIKNLQKLSKVK